VKLEAASKDDRQALEIMRRELRSRRERVQDLEDDVRAELDR